jgi:protein involved in sex pheromone biosynthesis
MKSMKKLIAVICVVLLLSTPFIAFSDEQPQGSTVIEKSDTSTDTQQGTVPDTQVAPQAPDPAPEQPPTSPDK